MLRLVTGLSFLFAAFIEAGCAQMEIGTQFTALRQNPPGERSGAMGARASCDLHFHAIVLGPEIEFNYFLESPIASYAERQLLAGVRVGVNIGRVGEFFKARPGLVNFYAGDFTQPNGTRMNLVVDVGGVLEYFVRPGLAVRMDWGDLMLRFPHAINTGPFTPAQPPRWYDTFSKQCRRECPVLVIT